MNLKTESLWCHLYRRACRMHAVPILTQRPFSLLDPVVLDNFHFHWDEICQEFVNHVWSVWNIMQHGGPPAAWYFIKKIPIEHAWDWECDCWTTEIIRLILILQSWIYSILHEFGSDLLPFRWGLDLGLFFPFPLFFMFQRCLSQETGLAVDLVNSNICRHVHQAERHSAPGHSAFGHSAPQTFSFSDIQLSRQPATQWFSKIWHVHRFSGFCRFR